MKINKYIYPFLTGEKFSNLEKIQIDNKDFIYYRLPLLKSITKGKNILHVGCCDHINLIESKIENETYLHSMLINNSNHCIGIDIDNEGIEFMKSKGIDNVYCYNILSDYNEKIDSVNWDYILLGEVLEHIDNPVNFLETINKKFKNNATKIIVTVPNAFSIHNNYYIKKGIENINTDHRYWFTPFTLMKVLTKSGYQVEELFFIERSKITFFDKILKWGYKIITKDVFLFRKFRINRASGLAIIANF